VSETSRREYVRPAGDEPLDAVQQALVRMWIDILAAELLEDLAAAAEQPDHDPQADNLDARQLRRR
jgi:alkylation response protein AidB-like acyl-CoA dehydrogenase